MRIRSLKPEFWRSEDIAALDYFDRLLFVGLWSYVDDNGVGVDRLADICADLFALDLERDFEDTYRRVRGGLQELSDRGLIDRYKADGKPYLMVTKFGRHQRIDKPSKGRYPAPTCGNDVPPLNSGNTPGDLPEHSTPGAGEQGSRGAGDSAKAGGNRRRPVPDASLPFDVPEPPPSEDPNEDNAGKIIGRWIEQCRKRPPEQTIGRVGKHVRQLLAEGVDRLDVWNGVRAWAAKGADPSTLPSFVNEVMNANPAGQRPSTTDARVVQAASLAEYAAAKDAEEAAAAELASGRVTVLAITAESEAS